MITPELQAEYEQLLRDEGEGEITMSRAQMESALRESLTRMGLEPDDPRIADVLHETVAGHPDIARLLADVSRTIEEFAPVLGENERRQGAVFDETLPVMCAEFPVGDFNASVRLVGEHGALVLINSGLLALLWQTAKLIVLSTAIVPEGFQYLDGVLLDPLRLRPADALADAVGVYLNRRVPHAGAIARPGGAELVRLEAVFRSMVSFVVAHEYAHVFAGHLDEGSVDHRVDGPVASLVVENQADWLGVRLLLARWRWGELPPAQRNELLEELLPGPLLFCALERLIAEAETAAGAGVDFETVIAEHAPTIVREAMIRDLYDRLRLSRSLADLYAGWVTRHRTAVLEAFAAIPPPPNPSDMG